MTDERPPKNDDSPFSLSVNLELHFENMAEFEAMREEYEALTAIKRKPDIEKPSRLINLAMSVKSRRERAPRMKRPIAISTCLAVAFQDPALNG